MTSVEQLKSLSPQLYHRLSRALCGDLARVGSVVDGSVSQYSEEFLCFAEAFDIAIRAGGLREIDFERAPEVSFNPRPARVAIIAMTDINNSDALSWISAIILSTTEPSMRVPNSVLKVFPQLLEYLPLGWEAPQEILRQLSRGQESPALRSVVWAALSNHLDRIRQLHRATPTRIREVLPEIQERHRGFVSLSQQLAPGLEQKFLQWEDRVLPRLLKASDSAKSLPSEL